MSETCASRCIPSAAKQSSFCARLCCVTRPARSAHPCWCPGGAGCTPYPLLRRVRLQQSEQLCGMTSTAHAASARTELPSARGGHQQRRAAGGAGEPGSGSGRQAGSCSCGAKRRVQRAAAGAAGGSARGAARPARRRAVGCVRPGEATGKLAAGNAARSRQRCVSQKAATRHSTTSLRAARRQRTTGTTSRDVASQVAPSDRPPRRQYAPAPPSPAEPRNAACSCEWPRPPNPAPAARHRGSQQRSPRARGGHARACPPMLSHPCSCAPLQRSASARRSHVLAQLHLLAQHARAVVQPRVHQARHGEDAAHDGAH